MADEYKGLYVKFGGDATELKTALDQIESQCKKSDTALKNIQTAITKVKDSGAKVDSTWANLLTKRMEAAKDAAENQAKKVDTLRAAQEELANSGKTTTEAYKRLCRELEEAEADLIAARQELVKATEATTDLGKSAASIQEWGDKITSASKGLSNVGDALTKGVTVPVVAAATACGVAAVDIDTAWYGLRKTFDDTGLTAEQTEARLNELKDSAIEMSKVEPISATDILNAMELGAQLGIASDNMETFAQTVGRLDVATNLDVETAATELAQFMNITGLTDAKVENLGSTIVDLGNHTATTESDILRMSMRIASAGSQAKMTDAEIMGIGAALSSMGMNAEAGGSAVSRVITKIDKAVSVSSLSVEDYAAQTGQSLEDAKVAWESQQGIVEQFARVAGKSAEEFKAQWSGGNAARMFGDFITGCNDATAAGENVNVILEGLGITELRTSDAMRRLAGNSDLVTECLDRATTAFDENTALGDEAEERYKSLESQLQVFQNRITAVAEEVGGPLVGALIDGVDALDPVAQTVEQLASDFGNLSKEQQQSTIQTVAMVAAIGPVLSMVGRVGQGIGTLVTGYGKCKAAVNSFQTAMTANNAQLVAGYADTGKLSSKIALLGNEHVLAAGGVDKFIDAQKRKSQADKDIADADEQLKQIRERLVALGQEEATAQQEATAAAEAHAEAQKELSDTQTRYDEAVKRTAELKKAANDADVSDAEAVIRLTDQKAEAEARYQDAVDNAAAVKKAGEEQKRAAIKLTEEAEKQAADALKQYKDKEREVADLAAQKRIELSKNVSAQEKKDANEVATYMVETARQEMNELKAVYDQKRSMASDAANMQKQAEDEAKQAEKAADDEVKRSKQEVADLTKRLASEKKRAETDAAKEARDAIVDAAADEKRAKQDLTSATKKEKDAQDKASKAKENAAKRTKTLQNMEKKETKTKEELDDANKRLKRSQEDLNVGSGGLATTLQKVISFGSSAIGVVTKLGVAYAALKGAYEVISNIAEAHQKASIGFDENSKAADVATESLSRYVDGLTSVQGAVADTSSLIGSSGQTVSQLESTVSEAYANIIAIIQRDMEEAGRITDEGAKQIAEDFDKIKAASSEENHAQAEYVENLRAQYGNVLSAEDVAQYWADVKANADNGREGVEQAYSDMFQAADNYYRSTEGVGEDWFDAKVQELNEWRTQELSTWDQVEQGAVESINSTYEGLSQAQTLGLSNLTQQLQSKASEKPVFDLFNGWQNDAVNTWNEAWKKFDTQAAAGVMNTAATILAGGGDLSSATKDDIDAILDVFDGLPPEMQEVMKDAFLELTEPMQGAVPELSSSAEFTTQELVDSMRETLGVGMPTVAETLTNALAEGIESGQVTVAEQVALLQNIAEGDWTTVSSFLYSAGLDVPKYVADGIKNGEYDASSASSGMISLVMSAITESGAEAEAGEYGGAIDSGLAIAILKSAGMPQDEATSMVQGVMRTMRNAENGEAQGIGLEWVLNTLSGMESASGDVEETTTQTGSDMGEGMSKGYGEYIASHLGDFEKGTEKVIDAINIGAGTHSPSWKTEETGMWLDQGLADGMTKNVSIPIEAAGTLAEQLVAAFQKMPAQFLPIGTAIAATITSSIGQQDYTIAGSSVASGIASGITGSAGQVSSAAAQLGTSAQSGLSKAPTQAKSSGKATGASYALGITGTATNSKTGGTLLGTNVVSGMDTAKTKAKSSGQTSGSNFASGISSKSSVVSAAGRVLANSTSTLNSRAGSAHTWGQHLGGNFAAGISSKYGAVVAAANSLASAASSVLKFSVPKEGPWSGAERGGYTSGRHLVENIASGMYAAIPEMERAARAVGQAMEPPAYADRWAASYTADLAREARSNRLSGTVGGATYNIRIDGMSVNDDKAMQQAARKFVTNLVRTGGM